MSTTGESARTGVAVRALNTAGHEDWGWMVAEDPALYLDELATARTAGTAGTAAGEGG